MRPGEAGPLSTAVDVVTGGAGFIGSHLVDRLLAGGRTVRVLDSFVVGRKANLAQHFDNSRLEIIEAEVAQGIQIPIQTVANNTVTVSFKEAVLVLKVTPQITTAGTVIMRILVENATADFSRQVNGIPPIDTQRANTTVQVNDGATTIIGGIFVSQEQYANERTPVLHRIPLLGWLFQKNSQQDQSRELLIFITPRIRG